MMILGTWGAGWAGYQWGPWAALVGAVVGGMLGGLLHAIATVTFGVDHIVSGVALTILASGVARYLSSLTFANEEGGGLNQSPSVPQPPRVSVPGVDSLGGLERKQWFLVSDLAGIVRGTLTNVSVLTIIAIIPDVLLFELEVPPRIAAYPLVVAAAHGAVALLQGAGERQRPAQGIRVHLERMVARVRKKGRSKGPALVCRRAA